jgi:hypothetical protein
MVSSGPGSFAISADPEYARHNGHAELLRERIDGVTGT